MMIFAIILLLQAAAAPAPSTQEQLSQRAAQAREAHRDDQALALYQQALRRNPAWAEGWWNAGALLYEKQQYAGARDALRKLIALDEKAVAGYALLGICEYETHEYDAAFKHLDRARLLGLTPSHPLAGAALYDLALLANQRGLHEAAMEVLLGTPDTPGVPVETMTSSAAFKTALGLTGLQIAKFPEQLTPAERELATQVGEALSSPEERSSPRLATLLKEHPDQPNLHYIYGAVLLNADSDRALEEFHKELQRDPRHVPSLLAIAREMERRGQMEKARDAAQRAAGAEPGNFAAHALLGRVLVSLKALDDGIKELETARSIESGSPQVYFALASAYAKAGRTEDAAKARAEFLRLKNPASKTPE